MKKTILLCLGICASLCFSACGEKENGSSAPAVLEFDNGAMSLKMAIAASGETQTAGIKSSTAWNVIAPSSAPDHITIAPMSGSEGSHTLTVNVAENPTDQPVNASYQIKGKEGNVITLNIQQGAKPMEHQLSVDGKNGEGAFDIYTWFGNKTDLNLVSNPAIDLSKLVYSYDKLENEEGVVLTITADKVQIGSKCTENRMKFHTPLKISDPNYPDQYVKGHVHLKTVCWLGIMWYGKYDPRHVFGYTEGSNDNWSYTWNENSDTEMYFRAYYGKNADEFSYGKDALPVYFADSFIPASEYTLTSGDTDKVAITKFDDRTYKIEVKQKVAATVPITYTCGDYVQKFQMKLAY